MVIYYCSLNKNTGTRIILKTMRYTLRTNKTAFYIYVLLCTVLAFCVKHTRRWHWLRMRKHVSHAQILSFSRIFLLLGPNKCTTLYQLHQYRTPISIALVYILIMWLVLSFAEYLLILRSKNSILLAPLKHSNNNNSSGVSLFPLTITPPLAVPSFPSIIYSGARRSLNVALSWGGVQRWSHKYS